MSGDDALEVYAKYREGPGQFRELSKNLLVSHADRFSRYIQKSGSVLYLPGGVVHAVLTTKDAIAISGSFLHDAGVDVQLRAMWSDDDFGRSEKYRWPDAHIDHAHAALRYCETLDEALSSPAREPPRQAHSLYRDTRAIVDYIVSRKRDRNDNFVFFSKPDKTRFKIGSKTVSKGSP